MNSTQATAATATGVAAALVIILVWLLGLGHLEVPQPVGLAFITVFTPIVHWLGLKDVRRGRLPEKRTSRSRCSRWSACRAEIDAYNIGRIPMCFSLAWLEHLIIAIVIVVAVISLLRLLVSFVIPKLGLSGEIVSFVVQAITIVIWAIICIALVVFVFDLISCLLGGGISRRRIR